MATDTDSPVEENASRLSQCADNLDQWRDGPGDSPERIEALNRNLENWMAMRTWAMQPDNGLQDDTRDNLIKLSQYVVQVTFATWDDMPPEVFETLVNVNRQVSEGLMEGSAVAAPDAGEAPGA